MAALADVDGSARSSEQQASATVIVEAVSDFRFTGNPPVSK